MENKTRNSQEASNETTRSSAFPEQERRRGLIPKKGSIVFVMDDAEMGTGLPFTRQFLFRDPGNKKSVNCIGYSTFFESPFSALAETIILESTRLFEDITELKYFPILTLDKKDTTSLRKTEPRVLENREKLKRSLRVIRDDEQLRDDGSKSVIIFCVQSGLEDDFREFRSLGLVDLVKIGYQPKDLELVALAERVRESRR